MSHSFQFSASVTNSKRLGEAYRVMESYPFSAPADSCVLFPKLDITIANLKTTSSLKIFCQNPFLVQFIHSFYTNGIQQTWLQWDQCVPDFPPPPLFFPLFYFKCTKKEHTKSCYQVTSLGYSVSANMKSGNQLFSFHLPHAVPESIPLSVW